MLQINNEKALLDKEFLRQLDLYPHKTVYAKLISLNYDDEPIEILEGKVTGGSINSDGTSSVRRTCSLTLVTDDINVNNYKWGLKTKIKVYIGLENHINDNYDDIIWFKQGIFIITSYSASISTNQCQISISASDKMCLLNGTIGGTLPASVDFKKQDIYENGYDEVDLGERFSPTGLYYVPYNGGEYVLDGSDISTTHKGIGAKGLGLTHKELSSFTHAQIGSSNASSFDENIIYYKNKDDFYNIEIQTNSYKDIASQYKTHKGIYDSGLTHKELSYSLSTDKDKKVAPYAKNIAVDLNKFTYQPGKYYTFKPYETYHKISELKSKSHATLHNYTHHDLKTTSKIYQVGANDSYNPLYHYYKEYYTECKIDDNFVSNKYYIMNNQTGVYELAEFFNQDKKYYQINEYEKVSTSVNSQLQVGRLYLYNEETQKYEEAKTFEQGKEYYKKVVPTYKEISLYAKTDEANRSFYIKSGEKYLAVEDDKYNPEATYYKRSRREVDFSSDIYQAGKYYVYNKNNEYIISNDPYDPSIQYYEKRIVTVEQESLSIKEIVREAVHTFGKEPYHNIIINDVDDYGLNLMEYRGEKPLYMLMKDGVASDLSLTYGGDNVLCYILRDNITDAQFTIISKNLENQLFYLRKRFYDGDITKEEADQAAEGIINLFVNQYCLSKDSVDDLGNYDGNTSSEGTVKPFYVVLEAKFNYQNLEDKSLTYEDLENYSEIVYKTVSDDVDLSKNGFTLDSQYITYNTLVPDFNNTPSHIIFQKQLENLYERNDSEGLSYYTVAKIEYGDTAGYELTKLVYPEDLISGIGESLTSILDKIKQKFSSYEYFYDVDGRFIFQKKPTYTNTSWNNIIASITDNVDKNGNYVENAVSYVDNTIATSACQYNFENNNLIMSLSYTPKLDNLKNDYSIWGTRQSASGQSVPIHMRYAIDRKPQSYISFPRTKFYNANETYHTKDRRELVTVEVAQGINYLVQDYYFTKESNIAEQIIFEYDTKTASELYSSFIGDKINNIDGEYSGFYGYPEQDIVIKPIHYILNEDDYNEQEIYGGVIYRYHLCDWREIIYQMAQDYYLYNQRDDFQVKLAQFNPDTYPNGYTGYEQYYTDMQGFWRHLYNEDPDITFESYGGAEETYYNYVVVRDTEDNIIDVQAIEVEGWQDLEIDYSNIYCDYFLPLDLYDEYYKKAQELLTKYTEKQKELSEYKTVLEKNINDYKTIIYALENSIWECEEEIEKIQTERDNDEDLKEKQETLNSLKKEVKSLQQSQDSAVTSKKADIKEALYDLGFIS